MYKQQPKLKRRVRELTNGRRLAQNTLWNLLGSGAPLIVAVVAIPRLIDGMGVPRFGILTLAWMIVGYFSLFDLGLGRALTNLVAEKLGAERLDELPPLIGTALALMAILGLFGAVLLAGLVPSLVDKILKVPLELKEETRVSLFLLAASIPIVVTTAGLRGILEAHQRFNLTNAVRIPLGILTFLGPLAAIHFSKSLVPVVGTLVLVRLVAFGAYIALCLRVLSNLKSVPSIKREMVRPLVFFGGWMTATNIISPLMVHMDRFLIGSMVSMAAVSYYATPHEVITRLSIIPASLTNVLFPAFSAAFSQDKAHTAQLFSRGLNYVFMAVFPLILVIVTFAHEGLSFWLGNEFADHSALVLKLLAFGVFINSLARLPSTLVQGAGRPDMTAKLHLLELPIYLVLLWWSLKTYGIAGAAFAWVIRITMDTLALFAISHRLLLYRENHITLSIGLKTSVALLVLLLATLITTPVMKGLYLGLTLLLFIPSAWFFLLASDQRALVQRYLLGPMLSKKPLD